MLDSDIDKALSIDFLALRNQIEAIEMTVSGLAGPKASNYLKSDVLSDEILQMRCLLDRLVYDLKTASEDDFYTYQPFRQYVSREVEL